MAHGGDIYRNKVLLDFSVNLNPTVPREFVRDELMAAMQEGLTAAGAYPDPEQDSVRKAIADAEGTDPANVFAGSGASEMILAAVRAAAPKRVLLMEPGFTGYHAALRSLPDCEIRTVMLREEENFLPEEALFREWEKGTDMLFLCDPWNPSGKNIPEVYLVRILEKAEKSGTVVLLDESFLPLSEKSGVRGEAGDRRNPLPGTRFTAWPDENPDLNLNVIRIRSYTKLFALPGIRMGYVISSEAWIWRIRAQLPEWNLSSVAAGMMTRCAGLLRSSSCVDLSRVRREREYLTGELRALGCRVFDSDTIFLLFYIQTEKDLYREMLSDGILIRNCRDYPGLGRGYYRVAVKSHEENEVLVRCLRKYIRCGMSHLIYVHET